MTKTADIEAPMDRVEKVYGRLDILVNNAGWCPVQPITEMKIEDYDRAFSLDVRALVEMTIHALPLLRETKGKSSIDRVWAVHIARRIYPCIRELRQP